MKRVLTATVIIIAGGLLAAGCKERLTQKQKAVSLLKSIETGDSAPVAYIHPGRYTQHNPAVADGVAGFGELLKQLPPKSARVNTVRIFQDGDFVITHTEYDFFGPKIGFDIFRFENGTIVEHWDNLQETQKANPSGRTMIDGPTEIRDGAETGENKKIVRSFVRDILVNGRMDMLAGYFNGGAYIQHNPMIADDLTGLAEALKILAKRGIVMKYEKIHRVLGEGNFVLVVSEGTFGGKRTSFYDLFRVENKKIAEHWDVIETILPKGQWKNNNGKF